MALRNTPGGVAPRRHKLELSNIEQAENSTMTEKRLAGIKERFPMHVHKAGGLVRQVENDDELANALSKGWAEDIRDVLGSPELSEDVTKVSQMTVPQALEFIAAHGADAAFLVEQDADERAHGSRAQVLAALAEAADAVPAPKSTKKPATPKKK